MNEDEVVGNILLLGAKQISPKAEEIASLVSQKKFTATTVNEVLDKLENFLNKAIVDIQTDSSNSDVVLRKSLETMNAVINFTKATKKNIADDLQKTTGFHEGFLSAVKMFEDAGASRLREAQRVKDLAEQEEEKRKPGQRPETLRVKRKAEKLRSENASLAREEDSGVENT